MRVAEQAVPIKNKLQEFCDTEGLSIYRIAADTGISKRVLYEMRNDPHRDVKIETIGRLCDAYGKPINVFLEWVLDESKNTKTKVKNK